MTSLPRRLPTRLLAALLAVPLLLTASCGFGGGGDKVTIVGQKFPEADVMTQLYKALLDDAGYETSVKTLGARDVYLQPLIDGDVQVSADYLSSMTEALNRKANGDDAEKVASSDPKATLAALEKLADKYGLTPLDPAKAEDANAYAVTSEFAQQHDLTTLTDLGKSGVPVKLGANSDCPDRQDCQLGLEKVYGINIVGFQPTGFDSQATIQDLVKGRTQLGQVGTTSPNVEANDLVILEDDQQLQNAENLIPIVNSDWLKDNQKAADALNELAGVLTTDDLQAMLGKVVNERQKPEKVAQDYLKDKGLI
ncbi:MAG TPA: ABC transporter substrate-binding protein [Marmoricola sp.]|jgi:osmoprotectant transport system substrate-binding protein|nr:ABC transporter substrate-binding protein [Marmoricola sp.]